jgi:steroid 5-alpha reductase family enzyme
MRRRPSYFGDALIWIAVVVVLWALFVLVGEVP